MIFIPNILRQLRIMLAAWPDWAATLVLLLIGLLVALVVYVALVRILPGLLAQRQPVAKIIARRTHRPLLFALIILALATTIPLMPITFSAERTIDHALSAAFVVLLGWSVIIIVDAWSAFRVARQSTNLQADAVARRHVTQWQVLRRATHVLTVLLTVAGALVMFPSVRAYGVSLLASAGAAGIVLGLAARPLLSNLIAGIQIAITQPLRIEDAVVINGQWGWIEEITSTYVVVRIWNWQRMVVPLSWLLENPFQNWTRDSSELIGSVHLNVDYTAPLAELRQKLTELVHATPLWSGKVVVLQVTHALPTTIELRALVSARNSSEAWDLRCLVREGLITFLQQNYPGSLPKQRLEFAGRPAPDASDQHALSGRPAPIGSGGDAAVGEAYHQPPAG